MFYNISGSAVDREAGGRRERPSYTRSHTCGGGGEGDLLIVSPVT